MAYQKLHCTLSFEIQTLTIAQGYARYFFVSIALSRTYVKNSEWFSKLTFLVLEEPNRNQNLQTIILDEVKGGFEESLVPIYNHGPKMTKTEWFWILKSLTPKMIDIVIFDLLCNSTLKNCQ